MALTNHSGRITQMELVDWLFVWVYLFLLLSSLILLLLNIKLTSLRGLLVVQQFVID